jgi:hypothetical protein
MLDTGSYGGQSNVEQIAHERMVEEKKERPPKTADELIEATEQAVEDLQLRFANNPLAYECLNTLNARVLSFLITEQGEPSVFAQALVAEAELTIDQESSVERIKRVFIGEVNPLLYQVRQAIIEKNALTQAGRSAKEILHLHKDDGVLEYLKKGNAENQSVTTLFGLIEGCKDTEEYVMREIVLIDPVSKMYDNVSYWQEQMLARQEVTGQEQTDYAELIASRNQRVIYDLDLLADVAQAQGDARLVGACQAVAFYLEGAAKLLVEDFASSKRSLSFYNLDADDVLELLNACECVKQARPDMWARILGVAPGRGDSKAGRSDYFGNALQIALVNTQRQTKKKRSARHVVGRQVMQERIKGLTELDTKKLPLVRVNTEQFEEMQLTLKQELSYEAAEQNQFLLVSLVERITTSSSSAELINMLSERSAEDEETAEDKNKRYARASLWVTSGELLRSDIDQNEQNNFYFHAVKTCLHLQEFHQAFEYASRIINVEVMDWAYNLIGKAMIEAGVCDAGNVWPLEREEVLVSNSREIIYLLIKRLVDVGNYEAAERLPFLHKIPEHRYETSRKGFFAEAYTKLVFAHLKEGNFLEAERLIVKLGSQDRATALGESPVSCEARKFIQKLVEVGQIERAEMSPVRSYCFREEEIYRGQGELIAARQDRSVYFLAQGYCAQAKKEKALEFIEQENYPEQRILLYCNLANKLQKDGRKQEAKEVLAKAIVYAKKERWGFVLFFERSTHYSTNGFTQVVELAKRLGQPVLPLYEHAIEQLRTLPIKHQRYLLGGIARTAQGQANEVSLREIAVQIENGDVISPWVNVVSDYVDELKAPSLWEKKKLSSGEFIGMVEAMLALGTVREVMEYIYSYKDTMLCGYSGFKKKQVQDAAQLRLLEALERWGRVGEIEEMFHWSLDPKSEEKAVGLFVKHSIAQGGIDRAWEIVMFDVASQEGKNLGFEIIAKAYATLGDVKTATARLLDIHDLKKRSLVYKEICLDLARSDNVESIKMFLEVMEEFHYEFEKNKLAEEELHKTYTQLVETFIKKGDFYQAEVFVGKYEETSFGKERALGLMEHIAVAAMKAEEKGIAMRILGGFQRSAERLPLGEYHSYSAQKHVALLMTRMGLFQRAETHARRYVLGQRKVLGNLGRDEKDIAARKRVYQQFLLESSAAMEESLRPEGEERN